MRIGGARARAGPRHRYWVSLTDNGAPDKLAIHAHRGRRGLGCYRYHPEALSVWRVLRPERQFYGLATTRPGGSLPG